MIREIRHQWILPHAPDKVWAYLTTPELLSEWLMENNIQPVAGHKFQFNAKPKIRLGFDGIIYCEILEVIPFKLLSYSWKGGSGRKTTLDSVVTWKLRPLDHGTELSLAHTGFQGLKNYIPFLIMNKGWLKIGRRLADRLMNSTYGPTV